MPRILLTLSFVLLFSASASAIMVRPNSGGATAERADRIAPAPRPPQVMCTQEAKMCPDGSSVGRTGPHCEFAPCPGETSEDGDGSNPDDVVSSPPAEENPGETTPMPPPVGGGVACPMIAKSCPDGSTVSPTGPHCEMPPCPGETAPGEPAPNGGPGGTPGSVPGSPGMEGGSEGSGE